MVICVESKLKSIGDELRRNGFEVYHVEDHRKADVFLYEEGTHEKSNYDVELSSEISSPKQDRLNHSFFSEFTPGDNGTLMVNVRDMTIDEITAVLQRRAYSPILKELPTQ